jgi:uncharacterized protein
MTTKEDILEFIRKNRADLKSNYSVEKIALFGSFARGEAKTASDIDLLVTLKPDTADIHGNKEKLRELFNTRFARNVDIASEKYLKPFIRDEILKEAIYA